MKLSFNGYTKTIEIDMDGDQIISSNSPMIDVDEKSIKLLKSLGFSIIVMNGHFKQKHKNNTSTGFIIHFTDSDN